MRKHVRPRAAQGWWQVFRHHGGWAAIVGAIATLILTLVSVSQFTGAKSVVEMSEAVEVEVVRVNNVLSQGSELTMHVKGQGSNGAFDGVLPIETLADLRAAVGTKVLAFVIWDDPVYVLRALPDPETAGRPFEVAALFVGALTLGFGGNAAIHSTGAIRARRFGRVGSAKVTGKDIVYRWKWERLLIKTYIWEKGSFDLRVDTGKRRLRFEDSTGRADRSLPHAGFELETINVGDEITVFRGIRANWWDGDVGSREAVPRGLPKVPARRDG